MQSQLALQAKYMLTYLICVGAVLQGDGNWLYDNWGSGSSLQIKVLSLDELRQYHAHAHTQTHMHTHRHTQTDRPG